MTLTAPLKTLLTLAVLSVLVLLGVTWGWSAMTSPFPKKAPAKVCIPTTLQPGDRVSAPKVTVSVYNASTRVGLAESTMSSFEDQGFGPGKVGNAPKGTSSTSSCRAGRRSRSRPRRPSARRPIRRPD
jgi:hypothetical protein